MSVLIEGISVVIRCSALGSSYRGGVKGFECDVPNASLRADGSLAALTFLHPRDVEDYVNVLKARGLVHLDGKGARDIVVVDQRTGPCSACDWVIFGATVWGGDESKEIAICASQTDRPERVAVPNGWNFDESLSASHRFAEDSVVPESLKWVRREDDVDVYFDDSTGQEFFAVRR